MSTDVDQAYFAWSQEQLTQRDVSTGVSVSQMLDHGSVSFGKFEFESLSWEKWSVFTHDRRQEEMEKFNGLVAEKKAYFEEYYKKLRALKALQQQQEALQVPAPQQIQQTELTLAYSIDGSVSEEEEDKIERKIETKIEVKDEIEENVVVEENFEEKERVESKKLMECMVITKGASSSTGPQKVLKQKTKPEVRPVSRNSRPVTRPVTRPAIQKARPPPPPPPQRTVRKVKPNEPSRSIPSIRTNGPRSTVPCTSTSASTKRPSSSGGVRRPLSSSGGVQPSVTPRRPLSSAGARDRMREKVQPKPDLRSTRAPASPLNSGARRMMIIPSTVKSNPVETKSETRRVVKEPLALNNNTTSVRRAPLAYTLDTSKSRSLNLPPKKNASSVRVGSSNDTTQPRVSALRNNTRPARNNLSMRNINTSRTTTAANSRTESYKPIAPRTSETSRTGTRPQASETPRAGTRPQTSSSSVNARKPRSETQKWR